MVVVVVVVGGGGGGGCRGRKPRLVVLRCSKDETTLSILLEIIVVRHFFFDPVRLEAVEQKSGTDIVTLVDVVFEQALCFVLIVAVTVVALVAALSGRVGGL